MIDETTEIGRVRVVVDLVDTPDGYPDEFTIEVRPDGMVGFGYRSDVTKSISLSTMTEIVRKALDPVLR